MKIAVTGASGLFASALLPRLTSAGHEVVRLVRRSVRDRAEVRWDPQSGDASGVDLAGFEGTAAVIHLAGANVGGRRWTPEYKQLIRDSRVMGTRTLVAAMAALDERPRVLVSGSAVGFYGSRGDEVLTEDSGRGEGFLADVCVAWEAEATRAEEHGIRTVCLRTGLPMSADGGAFGRLLPLFRLGLGGWLGDGRMWWPWLTLEDTVRAFEFCLDNEAVRGPVNLSSPNPARNIDVTRALAAALNRPALVPVPTLALRVAFGEFAADITASQRMVPARLSEAGFRFTHPDLGEACRWLVGRR